MVRRNRFSDPARCWAHGDVQVRHCDFISLGSGESGKDLAWIKGWIGYGTAVIEHRWNSGTCPGIACPACKNVIFSTHVALLSRCGEKFDIGPAQSVSRGARGLMSRSHSVAARTRTTAPDSS